MPGRILNKTGVTLDKKGQISDRGSSAVFVLPSRAGVRGGGGFKDGPGICLKIKY